MIRGSGHSSGDKEKAASVDCHFGKYGGKHNINGKEGVQEKGKAEGKQLDKIGIQEVKMPKRGDYTARRLSNPSEPPERDYCLSLM